MIPHSKDDHSIGGSDVIENYSMQLLCSEPIVILPHLEDEFIAKIGNWFDVHEKYHGNLCCLSSEGYCVLTWESW